MMKCDQVSLILRCYVASSLLSPPLKSPPGQKGVTLPSRSRVPGFWASPERPQKIIQKSACFWCHFSTDFSPQHGLPGVLGYDQRFLEGLRALLHRDSLGSVTSRRGFAWEGPLEPGKLLRSLPQPSSSLSKFVVL